MTLLVAKIIQCQG